MLYYAKMKSQFFFFVASYFRFFARLVLMAWHPITVVVMGSAGKTSTLYMLKSVLASHYSVRVSRRANSAWGVPLNILQLSPHSYTMRETLMLILKVPFSCIALLLVRPKEQIYLVELDTDRPGEILFFSQFIHPQSIVWISSSATHTQRFTQLVRAGHARDEIAAVAAEFSTIITKNLQKLQCVVYNEDSLPIKSLLSSILLPSFVPMGTHAPRWRILSWGIRRKKAIIRLKLDDTEKEFILPYLIPRVSSYNILATCIIAHHYRVSFDEVERALIAYRLPPGRSTILRGVRGTTIIDSSYNSSLEAAQGLVELLQVLPGKRKVAVLGDMRELGILAQEEHEHLADTIIKAHIDQIVLVGPQMKQFVAPSLIEAGYSDQEVHLFDNTYQAGVFIKETLARAGDVFLVKASQNTLFFEIIVELLLAQPIDRMHLCRRESVWEQKREAIRQAFYQKIHAL